MAQLRLTRCSHKVLKLGPNGHNTNIKFYDKLIENYSTIKQRSNEEASLYSIKVRPRPSIKCPIRIVSGEQEKVHVSTIILQE